MNKSSKVWKVSDKEFIELIMESNSISDALRKMGLSDNGGGSRAVIDKRIKLLHIDCSDLKLKTAQQKRNRLKSINSMQKKSLDDIFSGKCEYISTNALKKRLIREGVLAYQCAECGIFEWNNKEIALQLDHVDGNKRNNSKENLRILCPNCHSQTHTYAGKRNFNYRVNFETSKKQYSTCECGKKILLSSNLCVECHGLQSRKVIRPSKEELEKIIWEIPTAQLKAKFGVSDVAISKWCKSYGISKPPRGYWMKKKQKEI